jgi:hypothetical protein
MFDNVCNPTPRFSVPTRNFLDSAGSLLLDGIGTQMAVKSGSLRPTIYKTGGDAWWNDWRVPAVVIGGLEAGMGWGGAMAQRAGYALMDGAAHSLLNTSLFRMAIQGKEGGGGKGGARSPVQIPQGFTFSRAGVKVGV